MRGNLVSLLALALAGGCAHERGATASPARAEPAQSTEAALASAASPGVLQVSDHEVRLGKLSIEVPPGWVVSKEGLPPGAVLVGRDPSDLSAGCNCAPAMVVLTTAVPEGTDIVAYSFQARTSWPPHEVVRMFNWESGPLTARTALGYELSTQHGARVFAVHFVAGGFGYQALLEIPGDMVERVRPEVEALLRGLSMSAEP